MTTWQKILAKIRSDLDRSSQDNPILHHRIAVEFLANELDQVKAENARLWEALSQHDKQIVDLKK